MGTAIGTGAGRRCAYVLAWVYARSVSTHTSPLSLNGPHLHGTYLRLSTGPHPRGYSCFLTREVSLIHTLVCRKTLHWHLMYEHCGPLVDSRQLALHHFSSTCGYIWSMWYTCIRSICTVYLWVSVRWKILRLFSLETSYALTLRDDGCMLYEVHDNVWLAYAQLPLKHCLSYILCVGSLCVSQTERLHALVVDSDEITVICIVVLVFFGFVLSVHSRNTTKILSNFTQILAIVYASVYAHYQFLSSLH